MIQRCVAWCSRHSLVVIVLAVALGDMGRACATSIGGGRGARSVGSPGWSRRRVDGPSRKRGRDAGDARPDRIAQVGPGRHLRAWRFDVGNGVRGRPVRLVEEPGTRAARDPSPRRRPQVDSCRRRYAWKSVRRLLPPGGSTNTRWWARLDCRWRWVTGCKTSCCATSSRRSPESQRSRPWAERPNRSSLKATRNGSGRGISLSATLSKPCGRDVNGNPDPWKIETVPLLLGNHTKRLVGDVAHTALAPDMPIGITDLGGDPQVAGGIVIAKRDADPRAVIEAVERKLQEAQKHLPRNIKIVTIYNRLDLANRVEHTLLRALAEEVAVVVLVILMFLLHGRSALVPALTLPLVLLLTFAGMYLFGVPATIMSLGGIGIALGMAVDADVVALEACHRRLETLGPDASRRDRRAALIGAAGGIAPAILTSLLITALSFLPVFAFTGETGRLLRPLAFTKTLVIIAAAIVAVTLAPALRDRLLRGRIVPEFDNPLTRRLVRIYRPFVHVRAGATGADAGHRGAGRGVLPPDRDAARRRVPAPRRRGRSAVHADHAAGRVRRGRRRCSSRRIDKTLAQFPEVAEVFGKVGRADTATDPAPFSMAETTIRLKPRAEWPKVSRTRWYSSWAPRGLKACSGFVWPEETPETTAELVDKLDRATRTPGWASAWTAPARARMDMMSTGRAHAGRHPHRRRKPGAPGRGGHGGAKVGGAAAPRPKRGVRVAGRRALAEVRARCFRGGAASCRPGACPVDRRFRHQRRAGERADLARDGRHRVPPQAIHHRARTPPRRQRHRSRQAAALSAPDRPGHEHEARRRRSAAGDHRALEDGPAGAAGAARASRSTSRCPPRSAPRTARWWPTSTSIWIREPTWRPT